jgi:hypothetical protein
MFPGQLRPTYARHDRVIRFAIAIAGVVVALVLLAGLRDARAIPIVLAVLLVGAALLQISLRRRLATIRRAASDLTDRAARAEGTTATSLVLVVNVRTRASLGRADFVTMLLVVGDGSLAVHDADPPYRALHTLPIDGVRISVDESLPPRWVVASPQLPEDLLIAFFAPTGMGYRRADELRSLAARYFPNSLRA